VISVKPGFVHFTDGDANVRKFEQLEAGKTVQTGPNSKVEIGLGFDSLLRLDENSSAVVESLNSDDVSVRIESGSALVEVEKIDKPHRIRVASGNLKTFIDSRGVFRFSENSASVIEGRLGILGSSTTVQKGSQVTADGNDYRQSKPTLSTPATFKSFLNSPKAGFVNAVQGDANIHLQDTARSDQPIQTGPSSYAEVLLRPGAFMRLDENSSAVIDSATANDVVVHVVSGDVLIENVIGDERLPIRVTIGGTKTLISMPGLYRFTNDTGSVIDGGLRFGKGGEAVFTGMQVHIVDKMYETSDINDEPLSGLDMWSKERSRLLSKANFMADFADSQPNFFLFLTERALSAAWLYSPSLNGITFMPQLKRESYYGNSFVPSYPLMPPTPSLPVNVRIPVLEPALSTVTPMPGTAPAATAPAATGKTPASAPKGQDK
jgi:hypothetical protein